MAFEEKRAWIMIMVTICAYGTYLVVVLRRAGDAPLAEVAYVSALLWTVGAAIAGTIVLSITVAVAGPKQDSRTDQRDREIGRLSEHLGQSFLVIGAVAAMIMAMAEVDHFWIANAIYVAFVLSAILGSIAKIVAYRDGFQEW